MSAPGPAPDQAPTTLPARHRVVVTALVGVVALVVAVSGYLAFGRGSSGSPSSVVGSYLRALARGDARTALSLGKVPTDRSLLTAQILKQQRALGSISAIKIIGTDRGSYGALVHVRYRVGSQAVDNNVEVIPKGRGWTLAHTAVDVLVSGVNLVRMPAVFDQALGARTEIYVFPGMVSFGSMDPNFDLSPAASVFTDPDVPTSVSPRAGLSITGTGVATSAVRGAMEACARVRSLAPASCPQHATLPRIPGLIASSVQWQAPASYSALGYGVDERKPTTVHVTGPLTWRLLYRYLPLHARRTVAGSLAVQTDLAGTLTFDAIPPAYHA